MNNAFKGQIRTAFTATETEMADLCDDMIYCFQLFEQKKIFCVHYETAISSNNRKNY